MLLPLFAKPLLSLIEDHLRTAIPKLQGPNALLFKAASYTLFGPSKRLRPLFLLTVLKDFDVPPESGLDAAIALECTHTYSLIHDDLPCMDDDDIRRGKPALHKMFGEAQAILAGDYLLTRAFELLAQAPLEPSFRLDLITTLAQNGGSEGLIGGQILDLIAEKKELRSSELDQMHRWKTGSLFAAACEMAALLACCTRTERKTLHQCGEMFGIAFQISDDLADQATDKVGHKNGALLSPKKTFVSQYGMRRAIQLRDQFFAHTFDCLENLEHPMTFLKSLLETLKKELAKITL